MTRKEKPIVKDTLDVGYAVISGQAKGLESDFTQEQTRTPEWLQEAAKLAQQKKRKR